MKFLTVAAVLSMLLAQEALSIRVHLQSASTTSTTTASTTTPTTSSTTTGTDE